MDVHPKAPIRPHPVTRARTAAIGRSRIAAFGRKRPPPMPRYRATPTGSIDADDDGVAARIFGRGTAGNDVLGGGAGIDTAIYSSAVRVVVTLGSTAPQATGQGVDRLVGIENLTGSRGADALTGNAAVNVLNGAGCNDMLIGSAGRDRLIGGAGADVFLFTQPTDAGLGAAADIVQDFARGQDRLSLAGLDADTGTAGDRLLPGAAPPPARTARGFPSARRGPCCRSTLAAMRGPTCRSISSG